MKTKYAKWVIAYNNSLELLSQNDGLEITSAFKQCASDAGINEGDDMAEFVTFAWDAILGK